MSTTTPHGDIVALRHHLFASIDRLAAGKSDPAEIERAKAIADTAQVLINSAKVEVDFIKATGAVGGSDFIPLQPPVATNAGGKVIESRPGVMVTRHHLKG